MKSSSCFLLFLILFLVSSCGGGKKNTTNRSRKVPEANVAFIAMSKNIASDNIKLKKSESDGAQHEKSSDLKGIDSKVEVEKDSIKQNKPRQNIFIRQVENSFVSDFNSDNSGIARRKEAESSKYSFADIIKSKEQYLNENLAKAENQIKSGSVGMKSVVIGVYDSEKEAVNNAIAATSYIGKQFSVFKEMNKFIVKTNNLMEKKDAYRVANLGLKLGYYESRVVY